MDSSLEMKEGKIGKLMFKFAWPTIVAMLVSCLYNIVDRAFVGRGVGTYAIGATTVAFPMMMTILSLGLLIGIGATALISIRLGEGRKDDAELIAGNAITFLILLPLILTCIYLNYSDPILVFLGASPEVLPYARDFVHIVMFGSVFMCLSFGANNFIRAEGNPIRAMSTQILGAVINFILNYIFIFHLGLGVKGSALATVIGSICSTAWILSYYLSGRSLIKIRLKNMIPKKHILFGILAIGFAPCILELANCVMQVLLNKTVMFYSGDVALSASGIIMSVVTIIFMPILGITNGSQPLIGYNYGAREYGRVKEVLKKAMISGSCVAIAGFLIIQIWPSQIVGIFTKDDTALIALTTHAMRIYFAMLFVIGIQITCSTYFQAVNKAGYAAVLSLSRQVIIFIPLLLILPQFFGIEGVWITMPIADGLSVILTVLLIIREVRRLPVESLSTL